MAEKWWAERLGRKIRFRLTLAPISFCHQSFCQQAPALCQKRRRAKLYREMIRIFKNLVLFGAALLLVTWFLGLRAGDPNDPQLLKDPDTGSHDVWCRNGARGRPYQLHRCNVLHWNWSLVQRGRRSVFA